MHIAGDIQIEPGRHFVAQKPTDQKRAIRDEQLRWVERVLNKMKGESPSSLAKNAGLADNALTRFLDDDYSGALSLPTIRKISTYAGVPEPGDLRGFEEEAADYGEAEKRAAPLIARIVASLIKERANAFPKVLLTGGLKSWGYYPGDIVIVDSAERDNARPGELVCAQVFDRSGRAETVYRIFSRSGKIELLLPSGHDPTNEPLLVDNERVEIRGVVTETFRSRKPAAT
jgi:SOS-response transcriptional repressor LexA